MQVTTSEQKDETAPAQDVEMEDKAAPSDPAADEDEPAQVETQQDSGKTAAEVNAGQQNTSATAQAPTRVSQRTQNAKKLGRNEKTDDNYKTKSKVSVGGC